MRLIVISDTHGNYNIFHAIMKKHLEDGDWFLFLGDGNWELQQIRKKFPQKKILAVKGNCDLNCDTPLEETLQIDEYTVKLTHGHTYYVKYGIEELLKSVPQNSRYIVLYGHTHKNFTAYRNGIYIMNPGSPSLPRDSKASYGIVDITEAGVFCNIMEI